MLCMLYVIWMTKRCPFYDIHWNRSTVSMVCNDNTISNSLGNKFSELERFGWPGISLSVTDYDTFIIQKFFRKVKYVADKMIIHREYSVYVRATKSQTAVYVTSWNQVSSNSMVWSWRQDVSAVLMRRTIGNIPYTNMPYVLLLTYKRWVFNLFCVLLWTRHG